MKRALEARSSKKKRKMLRLLFTMPFARILMNDLRQIKLQYFVLTGISPALVNIRKSIFSLTLSQFVPVELLSNLKRNKEAAMNGFLRIVFLIYFITHIPITICVDMQGLFGHLYPNELQNVFKWYVATYNDVLMESPPWWLKSFLYAEAIVQFPFFFYATYALLFKKNGIRIPGIIYGAHVSTTVIPLLMEIVNSKVIPDHNKKMLFSFYFPYFLIPFLLMVTLARSENVFGKKSKSN